jgi:hypothetical protein
LDQLRVSQSNETALDKEETENAMATGMAATLPVMAGKVNVVPTKAAVATIDKLKHGAAKP